MDSAVWPIVGPVICDLFARLATAVLEDAREQAKIIEAWTLIRRGPETETSRSWFPRYGDSVLRWMLNTLRTSDLVIPETPESVWEGIAWKDDGRAWDLHTELEEREGGYLCAVATAERVG